jgi:hypothetical protein
LPAAGSEESSVGDDQSDLDIIGTHQHQDLMEILTVLVHDSDESSGVGSHSDNEEEL